MIFFIFPLNNCQASYIHIEVTDLFPQQYFNKELLQFESTLKEKNKKTAIFSDTIGK